MGDLEKLLLIFYISEESNLSKIPIPTIYNLVYRLIINGVDFNNYRIEDFDFLVSYGDYPKEFPNKPKEELLPYVYNLNLNDDLTILVKEKRLLFSEGKYGIPEDKLNSKQFLEEIEGYKAKFESTKEIKIKEGESPHHRLKILVESSLLNQEILLRSSLESLKKINEEKFNIFKERISKR